jgi:XTP/dITP diphosphohydrolase
MTAGDRAQAAGVAPDRGGALPRLVVATRNPDKFREIADLLAGIPFELESLLDHPGVPEIEETGATLRENAFIKAREASRALGLAAISDDSGLEVEALGGAPGVRSSRYAGEDVTYEDNWRLLLERMRDVPAGRRGARFACVAALVTVEGAEFAVEGEVRGEITREPRGTGGFGYDPVFFVPELGTTFAEAGLEAKQRLSHRARAFRGLRSALETGVAG